jgi:hypothetical protein
MLGSHRLRWFIKHWKPNTEYELLQDDLHRDRLQVRFKPFCSLVNEPKPRIWIVVIKHLR